MLFTIILILESTPLILEEMFDSPAFLSHYVIDIPAYITFDFVSIINKDDYGHTKCNV